MRASGEPIPCPRTFNPRSADELPSLHSSLPLAIKPAVQEKFFYAAGAKAWRANAPQQLHKFYDRARLQIRFEEILIQEIVPGTAMNNTPTVLLSETDGRIVLS